MLAVILILLGIGAEIVKANAWFIIPEFVSYVLFGIGGVLLLLNIVNWVSAIRKVRRIEKRRKYY